MSGGGSSGGGGGSTTTSTGTTYSSNLPEYAKPYYEELLKQGGKQVYSTDSRGFVTGVKPQVPFTGNRLAGFTDQQKKLQDQVAAINPNALGFGVANENVGAATDLGLGTGARGISRAFDYAPAFTVGETVTSDDVTETITDDTLTTDRFTDPGIAASYMDPYQTNVTDMLKEEARRDAGIAKSGRGLGSIGRGTFGGGRQALMEGQADRDLQTTLAKIGYQGEQDAFRNAQEQFERDQARRLQANTANQAADLQAQQLMQQGQKYNQASDLQAQQLNQATDLQAQQMNIAGREFDAGISKDLGLAGLQMGMEGGKSQANIAANERMTELKTLVAQATDAEEVQRLNQEIASLEYQQFREAQDFEKQQVQFMSDILRGNAGALGSTDVQYAAAPSLASQIGGGVAGIAGLYGALGGG